MRPLKRELVLADLRCPIMSSGTDLEIAEDHGVNAREVRELRDELRRDLVTPMVNAVALELAEVSEWKGRLDDLIVAALSAAVRREKRRAARRARAATTAASSGVRGGRKTTATGRSAGRGNGRPGGRDAWRGSPELGAGDGGVRKAPLGPRPSGRGARATGEGEGRPGKTPASTPGS